MSERTELSIQAQAPLDSMWRALKAPFPFNLIEIKPQKVSAEKSKALAVPYFDARAAMDRLDTIFTPCGWRDSFREIHIKGGEVGIICRLELKIEGEWYWREDGSELSDIEAFKGGISGAFKRAFSAWGCRYLYELELGWHPCELYENARKEKKFSKWTPDALKRMEQMYNQLCSKPNEEPHGI